MNYALFQLLPSNHIFHKLKKFAVDFSVAEKDIAESPTAIAGTPKSINN